VVYLAIVVALKMMVFGKEEIFYEWRCFASAMMRIASCGRFKRPKLAPKHGGECACLQAQDDPSDAQQGHSY